MQKKIFQFKSSKLPYYISGLSPQLLIDTGTHGDEHDANALVFEEIQKNIDKLPEFVYIPKMSPSAVARGTRKNANGVDLNRSFTAKTLELEAQTIMQLVSQHRFSTSVSFHEDITEKRFYLYDSLNIRNTKQWKTITQAIAQIGVELFTGIDDLGDPMLGYTVTDGYVSLPLTVKSENDGSFWFWSLKKKLFQRMLMPEIPGKISFVQKRKVVEIIFKQLLLKI